jgi:hypothetical protein
MLNEAMESVAEHETGRKLLEDKELETFTKRIEVYHRKLEQMEKPLDDKVGSNGLSIVKDTDISIYQEFLTGV